LRQLDDVRRDRNLAIDGQLFSELPPGGDEADDVDEADVTPDNIRRLGA
jgi:hypothetical protein